MEATTETPTKEITLQAGKVNLYGSLTVPENSAGIVVFAHGSGSSQYSPRNRYVAKVLNGGNFATLLFDLLTPEEETIDLQTRELRFDIELLTQRMTATLDWISIQEEINQLPVGLFGASTGAAAALNAAAARPKLVKAVVSRGGRPDLATTDSLPLVKAPTLLIVGGLDTTVIEMNHAAADKMTAMCKLKIVEGATHLFEEEGKLEQVAVLARDWFRQHLVQEK